MLNISVKPKCAKIIIQVNLAQILSNNCKFHIFQEGHENLRRFPNSFCQDTLQTISFDKKMLKRSFLFNLSTDQYIFKLQNYLVSSKHQPDFLHFFFGSLHPSPRVTSPRSEPILFSSKECFSVRFQLKIFVELDQIRLFHDKVVHVKPQVKLG